MTIARITTALVSAVMVVGCSSGDILQNSDGVYADAQAGNRLEARIGDQHGDAPVTSAGMLLGSYLGTEVGRSLRASDRKVAEENALKGLQEGETGTTTRWTNPETNHSGSFTPVNAYYSADNLYCRDYIQGITDNGQTQNMPGTACRASDGSWRVAFGDPVRRASRPIRSSSSPTRRR